MGKAFFPVAEHSGSPGNIEADLSLDGMNDNLGILRQARDPIPFAGKAREDDMIAATPAVGGLESARRAVAPGAQPGLCAPGRIDLGAQRLSLALSR